MAVEGHGSELINAVALLGAAVVAVPIFKRIGLGSVLGYLVAGVAIGPFGLELFTEPEAILSVAEIGVVLLLFVIGLEMKPSRLWALRRAILGLGVAQIGFCGIVLTAAAYYFFGFSLASAFVAAMGFTMTSTAIVLQLLEERGETTSTGGQRIVSVLLLEDLAIVPLLAAVALLAPHAPAVISSQPRWVEVLVALAALGGLVVVARYLLNPVFQLLAAAKAREVMTAAALLVVLGAALALEITGLSMAMGAFVAGVVLSESSFRHQLGGIEPFRGLLLGLFFLTVGMSLDLDLVARDWLAIVAFLAAFMTLKAGGIYLIARLLRAQHPEAIHRALFMAQGGEFAFVLYAAAGGVGIFDAELMARLNAAVILSMAVTPFLAMLADRLGRTVETESFEGIEKADGLTGTALVIGFGRFGQVVSQHLLARGIDVTIIDSDTDMIRVAGRFGFRIYYGDGTRQDVLHAAGAGTAKIVAICIDKRAAADRMVEVLKSGFPLAKILVRSYDRGHTLDLIAAGVDYQIRETFESAMKFGEAALIELGVAAEDAAEVSEGVRRRDDERLKLQMVDGLLAGRDLTHKNVPTPTPLTPVKREGKALSAETEAIARDGKPPIREDEKAD